MSLCLKKINKLDNPMLNLKQTNNQSTITQNNLTLGLYF